MLGILDQPILKERFIGVNGGAELLVNAEHRPLRVRPCAGLSEATLCATHPDAYFTQTEQKASSRLQRTVRMTRFGGDCYIFGALALGFIDLIVESNFHRWDVAALIPIVEGAGGIITNCQGGSCAEGGQIVAAGDSRMHAQALGLLEEALRS